MRVKIYWTRKGKRAGFDRVDEIMEVRCGAAKRFWRHFMVLSSILGAFEKLVTTVTWVEGPLSESEL
jgi:hypothetical protein